MARLQSDKVSFAVREEQVVIDVLLYLHKKGVWNVECQRVAKSFLEWLMVYRDSLENVFDLAIQEGCQFKRFRTNDPNGWHETAELKKVPRDKVEHAKKEHRTKVILRRSRRIIDSAHKLGIPLDEVNSMFTHIQHASSTDEKLQALGEEIVKLHMENEDLRKENSDLRQMFLARLEALERQCGFPTK